MADRRSLLCSVCLALAVFSLAGHFIVDAACGSAEAGRLSPCDNSRGASELAAHPLHTGVVTPAVWCLATPVVISLALAGLSFSKTSQVVLPLVQPPKAAPIA